MKLKKNYLAILIMSVFIFSTLQSVQGSQVSWKKGSKYTWITLSGFGSHYENETDRWDDYYFGLNHKIETKILAINSLEKEVSLEETLYFTPTSDEPFKIQEVTKSFDLVGGLFDKDITSLLHFDYEFDETENETYLNNVDKNGGEGRFPIRYFCTADWSTINNLIKTLFNDSAIIDIVNGTEITFRDFLDNCTYSIMGESNYTDGLNLMVPTNHHWSTSFDYSNLIEARGPEITSFVVEEANATFELQYSEGGALEKYYIRNKIAIQINNNYTYHQYDLRDYTLTESNPTRNLLIKIIPAVVVGVIVIAIVVLVVRISKKRRV